MTPDITAPAVGLHGIRLGDRRRTGRGWLIVAEGAVRGIMSAGLEGEILFGFACDRRIQPESGLMTFRDLDEAQAWIERRLMPLRRTVAAPPPPPAEEEDIEVTAMSRAEAEQALVAAAMDYCWSIRNRSLPDEGPLRRLWTAFVNYRRVTGPRLGASA